MLIQTLAAATLVAAASPAYAWSYRCPAPGTVVERTSGPPLAFRGSDPSEPLVCLATGGQRLVLGIWAPAERHYANGRAQITSVLSAPGSERRFNYFSVGRDSTSIQVYETWRFAGFETVRIPAGTFDAARLERVFEIAGTAYTYRQTVWIDRATNAPVKVEVTHLNAVMAPTLFSWEATEVRSSQAGRLGS